MPEERIELSTYPLPRGCATTTLLRRRAIGQRPKAAAIAYEIALGKGALAAMAINASEREKRRAAALRSNLKRRKEAIKALSRRLSPRASDSAHKMSPDGPNKTPKPS